MDKLHIKVDVSESVYKKIASKQENCLTFAICNDTLKYLLLKKDLVAEQGTLLFDWIQNNADIEVEIRNGNYDVDIIAKPLEVKVIGYEKLEDNLLAPILRVTISEWRFE